MKADQPTGKLTQGTISDILTRGDHPRGIKVRLTSGQIGRVQSLGSVVSLTDTHSPPGPGEMSAPGVPVRRERRRRGGRHSPRGVAIEADMPTNEGTSLLDYVRNSPSRPLNIVSPDPKPLLGPNMKHDNQKQLEAEFPGLDSALVAAILSDHTDVADAWEVLCSLT